MAHEERCNMANHQEDASQNHDEMSPYTPVRMVIKKEHKQQILERVWGKGNPYTLLLGM